MELKKDAIFTILLIFTLSIGTIFGAALSAYFSLKEEVSTSPLLLDLNSSLNELKGNDFVFWLALNNIAERDFNTQQLIGLNAAGVQCLQEWQRLNENCIVMQDTNESRVLACRK